VRRVDRWVGVGLALLGMAVFWSARSFPNVPGQKLGAGFLPMIVGAGLVLCAIGLMVRGLRRGATPAQTAMPRNEHFGSALVIIATVVGYLLLAERLGFLIVAPLCLIAIFLALRVKWSHSLWWAIGGTIVVHLAFYKLLRVPLPWGVLRPFY
jgi:putative tricarboxylic transport membrane protein